MARTAIERLAHASVAEGWRLRAGERIGPYEILRRLGAGGAGEVWRARDERLGRDVAVKALLPHLTSDPERLRRFTEEARSAGALNHPNIVTVHDVGEHHGLPFLVTECLEGQSLRQRLEAGPLTLDEAVAVALGVARGLAAAHARGIVHRDIKPENTFLRSDGGVKILDFGLATLQLPVEGAPTTATQTGPGVVAGTAGYMAPEQLRGEAVDARADLFALGVMSCEMLGGQHPFRRPGTFETLHAVLTAEPPDLPLLNERVPPPLARIVRRLLEKAPDARFQSALDLAWALEQVGVAPSAVPMPGSGAHRGRRLGTTAALATLALTGGIAGSWLWTHRAPARWSGATRLNVAIAPSVQMPTRTDTEILIALSPDGTRFVYQDTRGLYLRTLHGLDARLIPGTEGGSHPFFSADGRSLGFVADGRIQRVSLEGGAARTVTENVDPRGAVWTADGMIVYAPHPWSGLWRVPVEGGSPQKLTEPDQLAETSHRWPQLLPGGRTVLFTVQAPSGRGDDSRIDVMSLQTGERKTVVRGGTYGRYVPTGHLIFASKGTIFAAPFDLGALALDGPTVAVLEDVRMGYNSTGVAQLDFAPTGMAVHVAPHERPRPSRLWRVDRRGTATEVPGTHPALLGFSISLDGERLIAAICEETADKVWLHDLRRRTWMPVTFDEDSMSPVWSPRGDRFAFSSNREGSLNLYWMEAEGGAAQRLTTSTHWQHATGWSPDGRVLFFADQSPETNWDIWEVSIASRESRPVLKTPSAESQPSLSPDGRWLAYESDESGRDEVYVRGYGGTDRKWVVSTDGGKSPRWSRDGRELFYEAAGNAVMAVPVTTGPTIDVGRPTLLFKREQPFKWDVAPDARTFLIAEDAEPAPDRLEIVVIPDWFDELNAKARRR